MTDGTITLKRNCINRKCVFDLSLFLETAFSDTDFVYDYQSTIDDPFYKSGIELTLTADSNDVDIPFKLK